MVKKKEDYAEVFPAYPLGLDDSSIKMLSLYVKLYQLYYNLDKAYVIENSIYDNHFVRLHLGGSDVVYPWYEFMGFEVVDLVNNLSTITVGVPNNVLTIYDFIKTLDFDVFYEELEDWAEYLTLEALEEDGLDNIQNIFKMLKCVDHWNTKHEEFPKRYKDTLEEILVDNDEYYAANILDKSIVDAETNVGASEDDESSGVNSGVIPMSRQVPAIRSSSNDSPPEDDPEPEEEPETPEEKEKREEEEKEAEKEEKAKRKRKKKRTIKANIVQTEFVEHGIYKAK